MAVQFLASEELMAKYEEVKALLSHSRPDATFAEVLEVLLGEFIERHSPEARQKRRDARKAAAAQSTADGGHFSTAGAGGDWSTPAPGVEWVTPHAAHTCRGSR